MDGFAERYRVARKFLPEFDLGAYCGLGRLEPEDVETSFADHLRALEVGREVRQG